MSLAIPQIRMEIFRGPPKFFDDNFYKSPWTLDWGTQETDGDIETVTVGATGQGRITKTVSFNTDPHRYAIIKCTALNATNWKARFKYQGVQKVEKTYMTTGIKEIDLYTENGSVHFDCDKIEIEVNGSETQKVEIDYAAICQDMLLVPIDESKSDIVGQIEITLPLLTGGAAGLKCVIPNQNGEYTGKIGDFDRVLLYLWRKGASMKKIFGGTIHVPGSKGVGSSQEQYISIEGMGYAEEFFVPPQLVFKDYKATSGKVIIQDATELTNYVSKKFVDIDNDIATSHDVIFSETVPNAPIKEICANARTAAGVVGFDAYVDPAGNLHVFKRSKYTSTVDLSGKIANYTKKEDVHRIINKQKVYGAAEDSLPSDRDVWTESITDWSASEGSVVLDTFNKKVGTASIKGETGTGTTVKFKLTKPIAIPKMGESKLFFYIFPATPGFLTANKVRLLAPDVDNYFEADCLYPTWSIGWFLNSFLLGPKGEYDADINPQGPWTKTGSPSWYNIQAIEWEASWQFSGYTINIDGFYFYPKRYEASCEDPVSQAKYNVRTKEPIIDDSLTSNVECEAKAKSVVSFLKDKVITLSSFEVEGDNSFVQGDKQQVQIANDNIDDFFRILEIRHSVRGVDWKTFLSLSNEPSEIDYVFLSLEDRIKRLEASKQLGVKSYAPIGSKELIPGSIGTEQIQDYAVTIGKIMDWTVSDTPPESPNIGHLWLDISVSPPELKRWDGTWWRRTDIINLIEIGGDLDDISDGDDYGKVNLTSISAGNIVLAQCVGDLDDIINGDIYGKVSLVMLDASGKIFVGKCVDSDGYAKMPAAWRHGSDVTLIDGGKIYTGTVVVGKLGSDAVARLFDSAGASDRVQAWQHTTDVTMIDGGKIYTGTVIVGKLGADAIARMFGSQSIRDAMQGWRHASDLTLIDGGDIYTGTVHTDQIRFDRRTSDPSLAPGKMWWRSDINQLRFSPTYSSADLAKIPQIPLEKSIYDIHEHDVSAMSGMGVTVIGSGTFSNKAVSNTSWTELAKDTSIQSEPDAINAAYIVLAINRYSGGGTTLMVMWRFEYWSGAAWVSVFRDCRIIQATADCQIWKTYFTDNKLSNRSQLRLIAKRYDPAGSVPVALSGNFSVCQYKKHLHATSAP
ncbi:MAG: hypothetical protein HWN68_02265 [Desulfobacterales bacterium]|nr:hypothetical protein [Desulfobacterales bacterium]